MSQSDKQALYEGVAKSPVQTVPPNTPVVPGAFLPEAVELRAIPNSVKQQISGLEDFTYVNLKDRVLIVDPTVRMVVGVIAGDTAAQAADKPSTGLGKSAGAAAGPTTTSQSQTTGTATTGAAPAGGLQLTPAQAQTVAQALAGRPELPVPANIRLVEGARVPEAMILNDVPEPLVSQVSQLGGFSYAKLKDSILIVDPKSRTIAAIVKEP